MFGNTHIPDPHLTQCLVHILKGFIKQCLIKISRADFVIFHHSVKDQKDMDKQKVKTSVERVRNPVLGIKFFFSCMFQSRCINIMHRLFIGIFLFKKTKH